MVQNMSNHMTENAGFGFEMLNIGPQECLERGGSSKAGVSQVKPTKVSSQFGNLSSDVIFTNHQGWIDDMVEVLSNAFDRATDQYNIFRFRRFLKSRELDLLTKSNSTNSKVNEREIAALISHQL
jgi:hypothetical protein